MAGDLVKIGSVLPSGNNSPIQSTRPNHLFDRCARVSDPARRRAVRGSLTPHWLLTEGLPYLVSCLARQSGVTGNPPRNPEVVRPLDQRIVNSYLSMIICHWRE